MATIQTDADSPLPAEDLSLAAHPFRGLFRCVYAGFSLVILLALLWSIWAVVAHRRLQAQIDAIAALHQPFTREGFAGTNNAQGNESALALWNNALMALPPNDYSPSSSSLQFNCYPPYPPAWYQLEDQSVLVNASVFLLAHQAAVATISEWDIDSGPTFTGAPPFNVAREIADVLGDAIFHAHIHGDDALAIQRGSDLLQLARAESASGTIIGKLAATGISAMASSRLMVIAPDLNLNSAAPARVELLIQMLLDHARDDRQRIASIDFKRFDEHQVLDAEHQRSWLLGPMIDLSEARLLRQRSVDRVAAAAGSAWAATSVYDSHPCPMMGSASKSFSHDDSGPNGPMQWAGVYEDLTGQLFRYIDTEWRGVADRRLAAVALAIRLYRADHGDWPRALQQLVPNYLPAVPADPFRPGVVGYIIRKEGPYAQHGRPLLYYNLKEDPRTAAVPADPCFDWIWSRDGSGPQWRDLSRWDLPDGLPVLVPKVAPGSSR
jgi:hypothetical protein